MTINEIENEIIERIKSKIADLHIEGFPEKPSEFRLTHPTGAILVHYQGGSYSDSKSIGCIYQDKKLEFSITVVTRNLRNHNGSYFYLDKIRQILTGFRPLVCSKMQPVNGVGRDQKRMEIHRMYGIFEMDTICSICVVLVQ